MWYLLLLQFQYAEIKVEQGRDIVRTCISVSAVVVSSISTFAVTSVIYLIMGLCTWRYCLRKKSNNIAGNDTPLSSHPTTRCADVMPTVMQQQNEDLELKCNVAYITSHNFRKDT